jgi:predicted membrane-bound spermidine synthase
MLAPMRFTSALAHQRTLLAQYLADPEVRALVGISLLSGVVSSIALARLYSKLTPEADTAKQVVGATAFAVAVGVGSTLYYLNRADTQRRASAASLLT